MPEAHNRGVVGPIFLFLCLAFQSKDIDRRRACRSTTKECAGGWAWTGYCTAGMPSAAEHVFSRLTSQVFVGKRVACNSKVVAEGDRKGGELFLLLCCSRCCFLDGFAPIVARQIERLLSFLLLSLLLLLAGFLPD